MKDIFIFPKEAAQEITTPVREKVPTLQRPFRGLKRNQNINPRQNLGKLTKLLEIWISY